MFRFRSDPPLPAVHPTWLRVAHWLNAASVFLMLASGWRIYNASPLFGFRFTGALTLGGWLGGALQWHFAAMWLLAANGIVYLAVNVGTRRWLQGWRAFSWLELGADLRRAARGALSHPVPGRYNAIQKCAYAWAVLALVLVVLSGVVLWKSVQFPLLRELLGGYEAARRVHFFSMAAIVAFAIGHIALAAAFPRTLLAMIRGR